MPDKEESKLDFENQRLKDEGPIVFDVNAETPLEELLKHPIKSMAQLEPLLERLLENSFSKRPYKAFYPLMRLKGHFHKMHRTKLSHYQRYIYLNPIEGVLISYENTNKFPHAPNYIINLTDITILQFLNESRWFFKNGFYYFLIETEQKEIVLYDNNLDMVNFAINQIQMARRFHLWLKDVIKVRYNTPDTAENADLIHNADQLVNTLLKLSIPEVDKDLYSPKMNISVNDYARQQASIFLN